MSPGYDRQGDARCLAPDRLDRTNRADAASAFNPCLLDIARLTAAAQPLPH